MNAKFVAAQIAVAGEIAAVDDKLRLQTIEGPDQGSADLSALRFQNPVPPGFVFRGLPRLDEVGV